MTLLFSFLTTKEKQREQQQQQQKEESTCLFSFGRQPYCSIWIFVCVCSQFFQFWQKQEKQSDITTSQFLQQNVHT